MYTISKIKDEFWKNVIELGIEMTFIDALLVFFAVNDKRNELLYLVLVGIVSTGMISTAIYRLIECFKHLGSEKQLSYKRHVDYIRSGVHKVANLDPLNTRYASQYKKVLGLCVNALNAGVTQKDINHELTIHSSLCFEIDISFAQDKEHGVVQLFCLLNGDKKQLISEITLF